MTAQHFRSPHNGHIDRSAPLTFRFDGRRYVGYRGDTLASALVANGVRLLGRSFKYHRPRGLLSAGVEEPNALVTVELGARTTTNLRATEVELFDGLIARPVNCWPNVRFDAGAVNDVLGRFLPAGFYYKTFMWPHWHFYEWAIRRAAGLGAPNLEPDPDRYETRFAHCDVLVIGSGPAGLAAARAAARPGVRVVLVEQDTSFGGSLLWRQAVIDGKEGLEWAQNVINALRANEHVRLLSRSTAIGCYDHNVVAVVERALPDPSGAVRAHQRLRLFRAKRIVLASGAIERPLVFAGNDAPGVMLAGAVQHYADRYGARAGARCVAFTNNDTAYEAVRSAYASGVAIVAVVDTRESARQEDTAWCRERAVEHLCNAEVVATNGRKQLSGVTVRSANGAMMNFTCDLLAMSGGWNPTTHLFTQTGGELRFDEAGAMFRPDARTSRALACVGAVNGTWTLQDSLSEGHAAGEGKANYVRLEGAPTSRAPPTARHPEVMAHWRVEGPGKAFVDFQNDVTVDDIALAVRENLISVEHLKRYTTLGMAVDQGKTSNVNALAILGAMTDRTPEQVGSTKPRPPYTATTIAAYGGRKRGYLFQPYRRTALHDWHIQHGAHMERYGAWMRPSHYPRPGETWHEAVLREGRAVRNDVGLFDASSLGRIEICGRDAALFLDRIYANTMSTLRPGEMRYGLMLNERGIVLDDGICARFDQERFLLTTTSSNAERIIEWLEEWLQCEWRELDVLVAPVTPAWSVITISGPRARAILRQAGATTDLSSEAAPHMCFREGLLGNVAMRLLRASYSGELSFEINVAPEHALYAWEKLRCAGAATPVGIDAWLALRTEKGFLHIGGDTDGTTTALDVGWRGVLRRRGDFIGKCSLLRPANQSDDRMQFVGLEPLDTRSGPRVGAHLSSAEYCSEGYVTSSVIGPGLGRPVALGFVRGGRARMGETLSVRESDMRVRVVSPCAYDPNGARLHG